MFEMNRETPIRSSDSETLVLVDDAGRRRKRIAIIGAGIIAIVAIVLAVLMMGGGEKKDAAAGEALEAAAIPKITVRMTHPPRAWAPSWPQSPLMMPSTPSEPEPFQPAP